MTKHLVILSNRMRRSTEAILRSKGVLNYFGEVFAPEEISERVTKRVREVLEKYGARENPPIALVEMRKLCVFIGDSNVDIDSAHEQGPILTIATLQGMGSERVLRHARPYKIASSLIEVVDALKEIRENPEKCYDEHLINC